MINRPRRETWAALYLESISMFSCAGRRAHEAVRGAVEAVSANLVPGGQVEGDGIGVIFLRDRGVESRIKDCDVRTGEELLGLPDSCEVRGIVKGCKPRGLLNGVLDSLVDDNRLVERLGSVHHAVPDHADVTGILQ